MIYRYSAVRCLNPLQEEHNWLWEPISVSRFSNKAQPCFPHDGHKDFFPSQPSYMKSPSPFQEGTVLGWGQRGWPRQVPRQGQPQAWPQNPAPESRAVGALCNTSELCFVLLSNHFFWLHLFPVNPQYRLREQTAEHYSEELN